VKKLVVLAIILLMVPVIVSKDDNTIPWYVVEPWEVEVCSKWGGTATAQQNAGTASGSSYMFLTTITLQGKRTLVRDEGQNKTIYEAAWYFRPLDKSQEYRIVFIGNKTKTVYTGKATPENGDANYYAEESADSYTDVQIIYQSGTLKVPIVG
jgi:hypothetical protein